MKHNSLSTLLFIVLLCVACLFLIKHRNQHQYKIQVKSNINKPISNVAHVWLGNTFDLSFKHTPESSAIGFSDLKKIDSSSELISFEKLEQLHRHLSDFEIKNKISTINQVMKNNNLKKFVEFKPLELAEYQNLNRQKVVLTKLLLQRKFENLGYGR